VHTRRHAEPGGPRIGDPWFRYTLVSWSVTAILVSAVNYSSARNGAIPFKVQEEDWDRRRVFLAQCNFGVTFDGYGRSQKERRRDGRKQRTVKTKTKNNHATDVFTVHYTDQSEVHHGYPANISLTVGWCFIRITSYYCFLAPAITPVEKSDAPTVKSGQPVTIISVEGCAV